MLPREARQVRTTDQWLRCDHDRTFVDSRDGVLSLGWQTERPRRGARRATPPEAGGLAIDSVCRLYRAVPAEGRIEVYRGGLDDEPGGPTTDLLEGPAAEAGEGAKGAGGVHGDFAPVSPPSARFEPSAMVVDADDRLFVIDRAEDTVVVIDIWARRIERRVRLPGGARPRDLAVDSLSTAATAARRVYVLAEGGAGLYRLTARGTVHEVPAPFFDRATAPGRLAVADGRFFVLDEPATPTAAIVDVTTGERLAVPLATDLAVAREPEETAASRDGRLIVAREPDADLLAFSADGAFDVLVPPLRARGYDGMGIVAHPDGTIVYYAEGRGPRRAAPAPIRYERSGRLTSFMLDAGAHRTQWGRVFLDACIPQGTSVRIACITQDELSEVASFGPRRPPAGLESAAAAGRAPELSPTMPPADALAELGEALPQRIHRRSTGAEMPWTTLAPGYSTYEAPVDALAGRYLWVVLELTGNGRRSPKVRAIRVEVPSHDLVKRLPRLYSREPGPADFLRRYLAMFDAVLHELELTSAFRHVLLDPHATPTEALGWLAGFVGLVLDERLSEAAKRTLIDEAILLWRFRGTVWMLQRLVQIAVGVPPIIVERYRLRGLGGSWVGETDDRLATSVVGVGLRVGGRVGAPGEGATVEARQSALSLHAHRFAVVVPVPLSAERRALVNDLIETHRPAHTLFELCTVEQGMRVGVGLHVAMTSLVGYTSGFGGLTVGGSALGTDAVLGPPRVSTRVGGDQVGRTTRLG